MNVTDELLFPKAVGVGVSFFLFLLSFLLIVAIPLRKSFKEIVSEEKKKTKKRSPVIPVCVAICILSGVSCLLFTKQIDRSYDGIVLKHLVCGYIGLFFGFSIVAVLVVAIIRFRIKDDLKIWATVFLLLLCLLFLAFLVYTVFSDVLPLQKDFRDQSYVTYTGEFKNTSGSQGTRSSTQLLDGSGITVYNNLRFIKEGVFKGTVVYTERSHLRLEIRYDE